MKNVILYSVLAVTFGTLSAVHAYYELAIPAAIWGFSTGIWTALLIFTWGLRRD